MASQHGHADVAQLLAEQADTDKEFNDGATPFLLASQRGHADVAQPLCGARADIDKKCDDEATDFNNEFDESATPLLVASLRGQADVARPLRRAQLRLTKSLTTAQYLYCGISATPDQTASIQ